MNLLLRIMAPTTSKKAISIDYLRSSWKYLMNRKNVSSTSTSSSKPALIEAKVSLQARSQFFSTLPLEIRELIYKYYFTSVVHLGRRDGHDFHMICWADPTQTWDGHPHGMDGCFGRPKVDRDGHSGILSLSLTCRRV